MEVDAPIDRCVTPGILTEVPVVRADTSGDLLVTTVAGAETDVPAVGGSAEVLTEAPVGRDRAGTVLGADTGDVVLNVRPLLPWAATAAAASAAAAAAAPAGTRV